MHSILIQIYYFYEEKNSSKRNPNTPISSTSPIYQYVYCYHPGSATIISHLDYWDSLQTPCLYLSYIYMLSQQIFMKCLLCAWHYSRPWGYDNEWKFFYSCSLFWSGRRQVSKIHSLTDGKNKVERKWRVLLGVHILDGDQWRLSWEGDIWTKPWKKKGNEPCGSLREYSRVGKQLGKNSVPKEF